MSRQTLSWFIVTLLILLALLPLLSMISSTFFDEQGFSLLGYHVLWNNPPLYKSLKNSVGLALFVAFFTTFIGTYLALLFTKTTLWGKMLWMGILLIPLLIPPYIVAYGWYMLIGREGALADILFGFAGTAWVLFTLYLPIPVLIISLFARQINPQLEDAALLAGSWRTVHRHITLPLLYPALILSFLLVFVLSIGESSVANFLRFHIFPMESFTQFSAFYDFKTATIYTLPLIFIVVLVIMIEHVYRYHDSATIPNTNSTSIRVQDVTQYPFSLAIMIALIPSSILPFYALIQHSTWQEFMQTFFNTLPIMIRSLSYATFAALLLVSLGLSTAYITTYQTIKGWKYLSPMILFFFILSSIVIGISLILFYNHHVTNFIYASPLIIILGYVIKHLFLTHKILHVKLAQIPSSQIEAATLSGATWFQTLWSILIPLSQDSLILAGVVGFIFSLRESTITMLVAPAGSSTLSTHILTQMANGNDSTIAALCLWMILLVLLPLGFLGFYTYTKRKQG